MNEGKIAFIAYQIGALMMANVDDLVTSRLFDARELEKSINDGNKEFNTEFLNVTVKEVCEVLELLSPWFNKMENPK